MKFLLNSVFIMYLMVTYSAPVFADGHDKANEENPEKSDLRVILD